jgi:signal peptidase I
MKAIAKTIIIVIVLAISISSIAYVSGLRLYQMSSDSSMYPTLSKGDYFVVQTKILPTELKTGDILLIKGKLLDKNYPLTKRLIGLPNDLIEIKDDTVYVNGNIYIEPYVYFDTRIKPLNNGSWKVKKSRYFVLGDNRNNSLDSRYDTFGTVKFSEVLGELIFKF